MGKLSTHLDEIKPAGKLPAVPASAAIQGDINPDRGHVPALDGIRGMAVLMVMCFHFFQREDFQSKIGVAITKVANIGQSGVNLFFVLSGFLITGILLHEKKSARYFINFYGRRILRISPLYYLALAVFYFLLLPATGVAIPPFSHQIWGWLYLMNIGGTFFPHAVDPQPGHFWSLAVEEHFYLVWPAVVLWTSRRGLYIAGAICLAISILSRIILLKMGYSVFIFTLCQLDSIAIGSMLALFVRGKEGFARLRPWRPKLCLALSVAVMIPVWFVLRGQGSMFNQIIRFLLLAIMYGFLIASVLIPDRSLMHRFFTSRVLRWFGKYSYGLYVWDGMMHMAGGRWYSSSHVAAYVHNPALLILLCMLFQFSISIAVAYASWHLYEKQFLRFKVYFAHSKSPVVGGNVIVEH